MVPNAFSFLGGILLLCTAILFGTFSPSYAIDSDIPFDTSTREAYRLVGPVREVVERFAHWREGAPISVTQTLFDPQGHVVEIREWEEINGSPTTKSTVKLRFEYDSAGYLVKRLLYEKDGTVSVTAAYSHNERGNRSKEILYDKEGDQTFLRTYTWDSANRIREFRISGPRGELFADGHLMHRWTYEYDDRGHQIRMSEYKGDGHKSDGVLDRTTLNAFDELGHIVESRTFKNDGSLSRHYVYHYDKTGQMIEELSYTPEGKLFFRTTEAYEHDARGNWIKRKPRRWSYNKSGKPEEWPTESYVRTITYY